VQCKKEEGIMCTEEFRHIAVSMENQAGQVVIPDRYYVVRQSSNDTILTHENTYSSMPLSSEIILLTDNEMSYTTKSGTLFKLTVYIDGSLLVDECYLINNDGCHIGLVTGNTSLVVEAP
jgi:hypothetical protein